MKYIPLVEQAYKIIEYKIITLELKPDEFITEKQISELIGIGRMPIHEAFSRLERAHLVTIYPRKGIKIASINWREIFQQIELRKKIEPVLMRDASKNSTPEERSHLLKLKSQFYQASLEGNILITAKIDGEFNDFVMEICRNSFVKESIKPLWALARRMYFMNYFLDDNLGSKIDMAHCDLMEYLAVQDEYMVNNKTIEIIEYVEQLYIKAYELDIKV